MESVKIGGLDVAFERQGAGPPLVLVHGFAGDSREWRHQIDALSDEYTVVAWDAPGAGRSSDPPDTFRIADYADCLAGLIDDLGLRRPHVIGLSFGGALALELYRRYPAVPRSLVLASAYAGWAGSLPPAVTEERLEFTLRMADSPPDIRVQGMLPTMFSASPPISAIEAMSAIMLDIHPAGLRAMARSSAEADLRDILPHVAVPTLLLYGDEDVRAPIPVAEALHAGIPGSTLVVMSGVGHVSCLEAPDRFNAEVRRFLYGQFA